MNDFFMIYSFRFFLSLFLFSLSWWQLYDWRSTQTNHGPRKSKMWFAKQDTWNGKTAEHTETGFSPLTVFHAFEKITIKLFVFFNFSRKNNIPVFYNKLLNDLWALDRSQFPQINTYKPATHCYYATLQWDHQNPTFVARIRSKWWTWLGQNLWDWPDHETDVEPRLKDKSHYTSLNCPHKRENINATSFTLFFLMWELPLNSLHQFQQTIHTVLDVSSIWAVSFI